MQEKQKLDNNLLDDVFKSLVAFLFMVGSSIVFLYLIIKDLINLFS